MISKWESLFLLLLTLPILGHVVVLPIMLDVARRDVWISIFLSLPFALLFGWAIYQIKMKYREKEIHSFLEQVLGKWITKIFMVGFSFYFLFLTIFSFASYVDFVYILFIPETPTFAIVLWFMIFLIYAVIKGVKSIALTAGVLAFITMITGHTITLLDTPLKEWGLLKPVLEYGWSPVFAGLLIIISIWVEMIFLLFLPLKTNQQKGIFLLWSIGILLNLLMMLSTSTGVITIFGLGQVENMLYPAQEVVRLINLGFVDRFDVYGMYLGGFGTYIRCCLYFRIALDLLAAKQSKVLRQNLFIILVFIVTGFTLFLSDDHLRVEKSMYVYAYSFILYPIPFLLLFIAKIRKGREIA